MLKQSAYAVALWVVFLCTLSAGFILFPFLRFELTTIDWTALAAIATMCAVVVALGVGLLPLWLRGTEKRSHATALALLLREDIETRFVAIAAVRGAAEHVEGALSKDQANGCTYEIFRVSGGALEKLPAWLHYFDPPLSLALSSALSDWNRTFSAVEAVRGRKAWDEAPDKTWGEALAGLARPLSESLLAAVAECAKLNGTPFVPTDLQRAADARREWILADSVRWQ